MAFLGAVEIDDVQPFGAGGDEGLDRIGGVDVVIQLARVIALLEPDDPAGAEIDAGDDDEGHCEARISDYCAIRYLPLTRP